MPQNTISGTAVRQVIAELETTRKTILFGQFRGWAALIAGIGLLLVLLPLAHGFISFAVFGIALTYGLITLNRVSGTKTQYKSRYKQEVIAALLREFSHDIRFSPNQGISQAEFTGSQLFKTQPDRYHTEDLILGKLEKTHFHFAEVHAEYKTETHTKHGRREYWHTILKGVVFVADFNKNFNGITVVRPKDLGSSLGAWFSENIYSFSNKEVVRLENEAFNGNFVTYSTDQVEARYLLTPALMEKINELNQRSSHCISLSFIRSSVYIAFPLSHNYFEPPLFKSLSREDLLDNDLNILRFMFGIVDDLDLNIRIWTKD